MVSGGVSGSAMVLARAAAVGLAVVGGLLGAAGVAAQEGAAPGVTVIGYGEASAPAETAVMQIVITEEQFGSSRTPRWGGEPGAEERRLMEPIAEALVAAGVAADGIETRINPAVGDNFGPSRGLARLDVEVPEPTAEAVRELVDAAVVAAADRGLFVGQVGVGYDVADCGALEREAREAALADAREGAEMQADLIGVELGEATASVDQSPSTGFDLYYGAFGGGETGCAPPSPAIEVGAVSVAPYDPTAEATVEVYAQVAITFAIEEGAA